MTKSNLPLTFLATAQYVNLLLAQKHTLKEPDASREASERDIYIILVEKGGGTI